MQYYLAVDIGASSGRHILGHVDDGRMVLEEVYRFDNTQVRRNGHDCWDVDALLAHILAGLKQCKALGKIPVTMGVDTWGVDFVLLDEAGKRIGDAVAYRDARTQGATERVNRVISPEQLYAKTGIQQQSFNTIYQLVALQKEHPEQLRAADSLLMIPDYLHYLLTGVKRQEYTNATTSNLVNARTRTWDKDILKALGLPEKLFGALSMPGVGVGRFTPAIAEAVGFDCVVVLPATHDTGSAFLAVPARDNNAIYISSGTWSLLGVENEVAITSEASRRQNLTNEGGYRYRYRYLKNIMGLWMIQSIRRELNGAFHARAEADREYKISYADLENAARETQDFSAVIEVDDDAFLAPNSMIAAVKDACRSANQPIPQTTGALMQCVYRSLAQSYAATIQTLEQITGKTYTSINIVGGGSKDGYLNELTAKATNLPVYAGPTEGTALGNLMIQMLAAGEYAALQQARDAVKKSFDIKEIAP
jgi:rhamnulokinase